MFSLFIINETFTSGYMVEGLNLLSIISIASGIFVIISKNPIISVLFLICLFLGISGYLLILGINFVGLSYLLVYVGAVSMLFLFILMLINVRISELHSNTTNSIALAVIITIAFNYPSYEILPYSMKIINNIFINIGNIINNNFTLFLGNMSNKIISFNNSEIFFVTGNIWDGNIAESGHISSIGNIMYTSYSIWLILTSIILLLAMVGAIVITIKQKSL
jgi:NADH-ubiquinone oxidoreductase chain 6